MSGFPKFRFFARYLYSGSLLLLALPPIVIADDAVLDELRRCSQIEDSSDRLKCYDALSGSSMPEPDTASEVPPPLPAEDESLDDLGAETLPRAAAPKAEKLEVRATVVRCEKNARKKYLFYFENGQVWRQSSDKRIYFKECNFDVTIMKDFFGYKMQIDGEKGRIRISRIR